MPKRARALTDKEVKALTYNQEKNRKVYHSVGGADGLILQCQPPKNDSSPIPRSWIQRVRIDGKQTEIGLGSYPRVTLAEARRRANENKINIENGENPIAAKKERLALALDNHRKAITFTQLVDDYFVDRLATSGARQPERKVKKEKSQVVKYALPTIGNLVASDISPQRLAEMLRPIWLSLPETAMRVRLHTHAIMRMAKAKELYTGDNPAELNRLKDLLPQVKSKRADIRHRKQSGNQPALQVNDCQRFWSFLKNQPQEADRAVEFLMLTASRPIEARSAKWADIDLENRIWTVPADIMKMGIAHRVSLSTAAVELLKGMAHDSQYIFASSSSDGFISDTAMRKRIGRLHEQDIKNKGPGYIDPNELDAEGNPRVGSLHGMRSTFSVWGREVGNHSSELVDRCLAHVEGSKVTRSYQRTDLLDKRAPIMDEWGRYLANVEIRS
jgi:integrase